MVEASVVAAGLILGVALILLGALAALGRRAALRRELAAVRAGQYPAWQGYARYRGVVRKRNVSGLRVVLVVFIFITAAALGILLPLLPLDLTDLIAVLTTPANDAVLLICFATGLVAAFTVSSLIGAIIADAPAYRLLHGGTLRAGELIGRRLKLALVGRLPPLLTLDGCAVLYGVGVSWEICLALFLIAYIAVNVAVLQAVAPLQRWLYRSVPLERSQWAAMAPRVEAWARLAGQPAPRVYVRSGPLERFGNNAALGRSPGTLYLAEEFLANSEWRQQDALLCWLIVGRAPLMRQAVRVVATVLGLIVSLLAVLLIALVVLISPTDSFTAALAAPLVPILLIMAVLFGFSRLSRRVNRQARRILRDADRRAAELTGDPWGVMTMLATIDTLSLGLPALGTPVLGPVPSRLMELDALARTPGPRAPWAWQPVPSLQPVVAGPYGYPITVPLAQAAQAPTASSPALAPTTAHVATPFMSPPSPAQ